MKQKQYSKIIFVSEMRNPLTNASSTQIMTRNLLVGFNEIFNITIFAPIVKSKRDYGDIKNYYSPYCDEMIFSKSITHFNTNPVGSKISMLLHTIFRRFLSLPNELEKLIDDETIVVSHSPSIDGSLIGEKIKRKHPKVKYIQYWGDPIALSLITPKQYSFKRSIQKFVEKTLHKKADKIVYGTKSLYSAQIELFPEIKDKSVPVEVCYSADSLDCLKKNKKPIIGYFGNYFSNIRNIAPFYDAACHINDANFLICGKGNINLKERNNVRIMSRVPQTEVGKLEQNADVIVCLLNCVGIQIPGKVFYQTNTNKDILVILDGPVKESIKEELSASNRFILCENNVDSINDAIMKIINQKNKNVYDASCFAPSIICSEIVK